MNEVQESLVIENQKLVYYVANRLRHRAFAVGVEFEDLVATGMLGLCKAALVYDPSRAKFSTVAVMYIQHEMMKLVDRARRRPKTVPFVVPWDQDESDSGHSESAWFRCEADLSDVEWRDFVSRLTERERTLLMLAASGCTQREIAQRLGLSQAHVSRLLNGLHRRWSHQLLRAEGG